MRSALHPILDLAQTASPDELAVLLGELRTIEVIASGRLSAPAVARIEDSRLDIRTAAKRLGVSASYLYRNAAKFSFIRREGKRILIDRREFENYLRKSR